MKANIAVLGRLQLRGNHQGPVHHQPGGSREGKKGSSGTSAGTRPRPGACFAAAERPGWDSSGSYPITPATEILQEIAKRKHLGAIAFQAEDEIAGITSAIGASLREAGLHQHVGARPRPQGKPSVWPSSRNTLVIVNVQRGGRPPGCPPDGTGRPVQALYGRNGESPVIILAATTPANCFSYAFEAAKLSVEHMTPVILLDSTWPTVLSSADSLGQPPGNRVPGSRTADPTTIPTTVIPSGSTATGPSRSATASATALAGWRRGRDRIGRDPMNHQIMVEQRDLKVQGGEFIPKQEIIGEKSGDLLVVGWGGTGLW
ncbi:MAG: hypothetical protein R2751_17855 [Bacteroidales bacterium]